MKRLTSIFLVLAMLLTLAPMNIFAAEAENTVFSDMKETDYYAQAATALEQLDILAGYPDGTFGAEKSITRAEMAAIVCRMIDKEADAEKAKGETIFDDVSSDHWASGYINIASKEGIINGDGNGKFRPEDDVKHEEAIKMVVCALGYGDDVEVDAKDWSKGYLEVADEKGISADLKGTKGKASTRGDVAVMSFNGLSVDLAAPTTSLKAGSYRGTKTVKLETATEGAEIYYTTDGSTPTVNSKKYTNSISLSKTCTLKAIAVKDGVLVSDVLSVNYTIKRSSGGGVSSRPSTPSTYTVSFDLNYEGATDASASQTVNSGDKATEPDSPIRQTHAFLGWYDSNNELFDFDTAITSNIVLKANWIDLTDTTDTDSDGLIDVLEEYHKTDKTLADTDNDGINDYIELAELGMNPLKEDTDENGTTDGNEDMDEDTIINSDEISYGTNPLVKDTDNDELSDYDEINIYSTDPLNDDTDGDGASDGAEIEIGTDPNSVQTTFSMNISADNSGDGTTASVQMNLSGEQVETLSIEPVKNETFFPKNMPGYMGQAYDFNVEGEFDSAAISFEFDASKLGPDADPIIYYFNEETQELEELPTTISGNVATATVSHFSKYILIDRTIYEESFEWIDVWDSTKNYTGVEIILVIDDSGSMTSNDGSNKRLEVAKNMVDKLPENSKIGIVQFESDTTILTSALTDDKETAKSYLTTSYFKSSGGTYMYRAINDAFSLYESSDESIMKVMVVLTDGATSGTSAHSSTIATANSNDIRIYTVGLGNSTSYFNNYLKPLAVNTAAAFYLADDAEQLEDIYNNISQKIDIETDSDNDGIPDYYEDNMIIFSGVSLALDKNNPDTDGDGIIDGDELELKYEYNSDRTKVKVTGTLFADPTVAYSDEDAYDDYSEIYIYNTNPFERNVIIDDSYLSLLTNDDFYYASSYRDRYENEALLRASIWVGNNIYGSNHSEKLIYKKAMLSYFDKINAANQERQEKNEAYDLALDIVNATKSAIEVAGDELNKANAVDALSYLDNLSQQADNIRKSLIEMKYDGNISKSAFYNKIDELQSALIDVTGKSEELKNALTKGPDGKMRLELEVPTGLKTAGKVFDVGLNIVNVVVVPAADAYGDYVQLKSNMNVIKNNIYILNSIINTTDNEELRSAAQELKTASESEFNAKVDGFVQGFENVGTEGFWFACHSAVAKFVPYGFWIELGLGLADLIIPVSETSEEGLTIYGMAKVADSLSSDIIQYLNYGKQTDINGNTIYAMYSMGPESVNRFVNFAEMRIYGEEKMQELQDGPNWVKTLLKLLGTDSDAIISDCNDTISTINGFKNMYNYKY